MSMRGALSGRRVLLVEDEVMVAWALQDMLTDIGCTVIGPAGRAVHAMVLIDVETIDAAVLDINLGGETSYLVADLLAARGVPFVFSTGYDQDGLIPAYRAFPTLQKPYQHSELARTLGALFVPKAPRFDPFMAAVM